MPALRAAETPLPEAFITFILLSFPAYPFAISQVLSEEPSSTIISSHELMLWSVILSRQRFKYFSALNAGTITEISGDIQRPFRLNGSRHFYPVVASAVFTRRNAILPVDKVIDCIVEL